MHIAGTVFTAGGTWKNNDATEGPPIQKKKVPKKFSKHNIKSMAHNPWETPDDIYIDPGEMNDDWTDEDEDEDDDAMAERVYQRLSKIERKEEEEEKKEEEKFLKKLLEEERRERERRERKLWEDEMRERDRKAKIATFLMQSDQEKGDTNGVHKIPDEIREQIAKLAMHGVHEHPDYTKKWIAKKSMLLRKK